MKVFNSFGGDPEFFVVDNDNENIPLYDLIGTERIQLPSCEIYADNMLGECAFEPSKTWVEFIENWNKVHQEIVSYLYKFEAHPIFKTEGTFADHFYENSLAHEIGCEPFYIKGEKFESSSYGDMKERFAGGHIHLGFNVNKVPSDVVAEWLEEEFAPYWEEHFANDNRTALGYGRTGAYRYKPYGIEYRSLPADWYYNTDLQEIVHTVLQRVDKRLAEALGV